MKVHPARTLMGRFRMRTFLLKKVLLGTLNIHENLRMRKVPMGTPLKKKEPDLRTFKGAERLRTFFYPKGAQWNLYF